MPRKPDFKKSEIWRQHLINSRQYAGTQTSFCAEAGISVRNFNYWKQRFRKEDCVTPTKAKPNLFLPVRVKLPSPEVALVQNHVPDPKWVAEIIFELSRRVS